MRIECIVNYPEFVPTIAQWHFSEWGHLDPTGSLEFWEAGLARGTKRDAIPTTYVAIEGSEPIGSTSLVEHDMDTRRDLSPWIAGVFVVPAHRHKGVASALVTHAMEKARTMRVRTLYLYTQDKQPLYEKLGWSQVEDDFYEGQTVTIMTAELDVEGGPGADRPRA